MYVVTRRLFLALAVAIIAASAVVPAQRGGQMTAEQMERRWQLERELQSLAIVDRKVMMPMRDGVRLATDIYRPKNASRQGADRLREDALQLQLLGRQEPRSIRHDRGDHRHQARLRLRRPERARTFLLRRELRHSRAAGDRRLRHDGLAREAGMVEREGRCYRLFVDRGVSAGGSGTGTSRVRGDERAGLRRRDRSRRAVLRAGQLVPRRRGADAVHHLDLRPAEPGAPDVPAEHAAGGPRCRIAPVRPGAPDAVGRLVEGAGAPAGSGHPEERRRARAASSPTRCRSRPAGA